MSPSQRDGGRPTRQATFCPNPGTTCVLVDNPLLTLLGRRGRGAIVEAMLRNPGRTWTVRTLARFADVPPMVASRACRELAALGAVDAIRPGRDARVRFLPATPAGRFLARLRVPDLHGEAAALFAKTYAPPPGITWMGRWRHPADDPAAPTVPLRIALIARDPEAALDASGPALDALRARGHPPPELSAWTAEQVRGAGDVAAAIRAGVELPLRRTR
jgi:hypothetical protein